MIIELVIPLLEVFVPGRPAPQGSKQARPIYKGRGTDKIFTGAIAQVESSKALKPWRSDIRDHVRTELGDPFPPIEGPVRIDLTFVLPRPASTPKHTTPPAIKRPDIDKLARAVLDALGSAGLFHDDSQVTQLYAEKRLAELNEASGCHILVSRP